ncbi:hypothetical protein [Halobacterium litoreum]|uniref:Uncharacterized protein n=1 Tax=Halobacterium litoreum TaxID=2039234 RepID=A0ABD5N7U8_9EURY|nr:hypothetical protein [Halobacterium litoreum]UHH14869.1 hypothetical protein LT972_14780 [Halobacterium litoreum]
MGVEQFSQLVAGDGGTLATSTSGTVETDNYTAGAGFDAADGEVTLNPAETIQELGITGCGADAVATLSTVGGDDVVVPLRGANVVWDTLEVDSVSITDSSNDRLTGWWAGE